jgi:hypothetical protein
MILKLILDAWAWIVSIWLRQGLLGTVGFSEELSPI